jgi:CubicO group peptidase (beta-lactamase class C family)
LGEWIASELTDFEIPGAAVAIVTPDREEVLAFGVKNVDAPDRIDSDTAFSLASCSKAFTAFGVALLVDRGILGFDDPVRNFIPEFTLETTELSECATLRDLLGMRLGLRPLGACHWGRSRAVSHADILQRLQYLPRISPFREGFVYFNPAYSALAETISRVSGDQFADFMSKEVFQPLGMVNTFIEELPVADRQNIARPHVKLTDEMMPLSLPQCGGREGESCMYISAADYVPWLNLNLRGTLATGRRMLAPSVQTEFTSIQMRIPGPSGDSGYCMGWMRGTMDDRVVLSHEGGELGASTFAILCPEERIGIAVLLSRRAAACVRLLAYGIRDRLIGVARADRKQEFLDLDKVERDSITAEINRNFPVEATSPIPDLSTLCGSYRSSHSGVLQLEQEGDLLHATFADVDLYNCRLEPAGGEIFRIVKFDHPAMVQEARGEHRLRIVEQDGNGRRVETLGVGTFDRVS